MTVAIFERRKPAQSIADATSPAATSPAEMVAKSLAATAAVVQHPLPRSVSAIFYRDWRTRAKRFSASPRRCPTYRDPRRRQVLPTR
jgi:hypothetical protein